MRAASTACTVAGDLDGQQGPRHTVAATLAEQGPGFDEGPHALFQEEGVPLRPRDQGLLERLEVRGIAKEDVQELARALGRQRVEA